MPRRRNDETQWHARAGDGGWAAIEGAGERVAVRVEADDAGRYRIRELHLLDTGEPITAARLRAVRVAALEQLLNLPEERAEIDKRRARRPSVDVEAAVGKFGVILVEVKDGISIADEVTLGLGTVHDKRGGARAAVTASGTAARGLRTPPPRGYSDDFYADVAQVYRAASRTKPGKPVMAVAAAWNVPRSTAARWVKEARRRHKLGDAPATGKAGG